MANGQSPEIKTERPTEKLEKVTQKETSSTEEQQPTIGLKPTKENLDAIQRLIEHVKKL